MTQIKQMQSTINALIALLHLFEVIPAVKGKNYKTTKHIYVYIQTWKNQNTL